MRVYEKTRVFAHAGSSSIASHMNHYPNSPQQVEIERELATVYQSRDVDVSSPIENGAVLGMNPLEVYITHRFTFVKNEKAPKNV